MISSDHVEIATKNKSDKLSLGQLINYSSASLGENIVWGLVGTYLLIFYTDSWGLNAGAVGLLMLIARFVDAFTDIFIGIGVDNTNTRWGKFRPWIFMGGIICTIVTISLFISPNFSAGGKLIYAYITYIAWSISYSTVDIPYWSIAAAITRDPADRAKAVTIPRSVANVGGWIASVIVLPLVALFNGYTGAAIAISLFYLLSVMVTAFGVKERYVVPRQEHQSLIKVVKGFFGQNRPFRMVIIALFILEITYYTRGAMQVYYVKYNLNAVAFTAVFLGVCTAFQIVGGLFVPWTQKHFGKRKTALFSNVMMGLSFCLTALTPTNVVLVTVWNSMVSFFFGLSFVTMSAMLPDVVDYDEWKGGERSEGMIFSLNIFKSKVAAGLSSGVAGWVLAWAGYQANPTQSSHTLFWMMMIFSLIPGIIAILGFIPIKRYGITPQVQAQMLSDLSKKTKNN
ncbi:MFS transporter [Lentilactobacillus raoultii]|uniref:MFS transporter n=1 Tax=Lentilactobacillus raoultii TaxID=1987503 RepID=A0ABW3PPS6_9LACO|nr:glycoside-pentoside-hexuronide (GPH):cation symporter [Lentilactobacillus raoultii]